MKPFTYVNPTEIQFGRGVIPRLGIALRRLGVKKVLLVYGGGSIHRNGVYETVATSLKSRGVTVVEHPGVRGNPVLSHVRAGIETARAESVDGVCGVGGGSVIDEAKAIAAGTGIRADVWELFAGRAAPKSPLPLVAVLTLPATGSEMNGITVVTNEETAEKNALVCPGVLNPRVSFLDPETTFSLPPRQTAFACTDILSHVMEAYFTTPAERLPMQDNLIEGVARGTVEAMETLLARPDDYDARAAFMWAATLGWSGICQAGIPDPSMPCHALEMPMSAVYDMPHGAGLSVVIPAWIRVVGERHERRIGRFFEAVFGETGSPEALAEALRRYYRHIGTPVTFAEAGTPSPDIDRLVRLASRAFVQRRMTDYTEPLIETIYRCCL